MAIYSRKRKKSGFRIFIYSLFFLLVFLILGYYFFYPNNLKTVLDENLSDKIVETQNEVEVEKVSEINENEYFQSEIDIDLSNYLEKSDFAFYIVIISMIIIILVTYIISIKLFNNIDK